MILRYQFKCGCERLAEEAIRIKAGVRCPDHNEPMTHKILRCNWCGGEYRIHQFHGHISGKCPTCKDYLTLPEAARITGISEMDLSEKLESGIWKKHVHLGEVCLKRNQVYSIKQRVKKNGIKKSPGKPCDKYNCAYRGQCLGTPQFYQPCDRYRPEYEAGDFVSVRMDLYERTLAGGAAV